MLPSPIIFFSRSVYGIFELSSFICTSYCDTARLVTRVFMCTVSATLHYYSTSNESPVLFSISYSYLTLLSHLYLALFLFLIPFQFLEASKLLLSSRLIHFFHFRSRVRYTLPCHMYASFLGEILMNSSDMIENKCFFSQYKSWGFTIMYGRHILSVCVCV